MNQNQKLLFEQTRLQKLVVLSSLFVEIFEDDRIVHSDESLQLYNEMKKVNEILLNHLDIYYNNDFVKSTTFFNEVQNSFHFSFKAQFKRAFKIDIDKFLGFKL